MFRKSSIAAIQQRLTQIETLRYDQLNGLLEYLENQKVKLPIEDHLIINWGIGLVQAKMQDENQFMREIDEEWEQLKRKYKQYELFRNSEWKNLKLNKPEHEDVLYKIGWDNLVEIAGLSSKEDRTRTDFESLVIQFKKFLFRFCDEQGAVLLFDEFISDYIKTCDDSPDKNLKDLKTILQRPIKRL